LEICAPTHSGVAKLLDATLQNLGEIAKKLPSVHSEIPVFRPHLEAKSKSFSVTKKNKKLFVVAGPRLEQIVVMSDLANPEALARVQDVLKKFGVNRELAKIGADPGATIEIAGKKLEWWG
jgi:GTP-binding protein